MLHSWQRTRWCLVSGGYAEYVLAPHSGQALEVLDDMGAVNIGPGIGTLVTGAKYAMRYPLDKCRAAYGSNPIFEAS